MQLTNWCLVFTVVDSGHLLSERRLSSQRSTVCRSGTSLWWVIMCLWCHHFNFDEELAYEWYDIDRMSCTVPIRLELYVNFIDGSACEVICDLKSLFKWFWFEITFQPVICDFDFKSLFQWFWFWFDHFFCQITLLANCCSDCKLPDGYPRRIVASLSTVNCGRKKIAYKREWNHS